LAVDAWLDGEAWRKDPDFGVFVILQRRFVGLLPAAEPNPLRRGETARFRVARILADGKVEVSLRDHGHQESSRDAQLLLDRLRAANPPRVNDATAPERLRQLFGMSKKAFKRAVGRLLRDRTLQWDADGFLVAK
jgi:predicted RNA-binding protein (virulence factor B family)